MVTINYLPRKGFGMIQRMIKCLGHRAALLVVLLGASCFVMKECPAVVLKKKQVEDLLKDKKMYRPAHGWVKIIDYKPNYSGGKSYKLNNIPDLFEAMYYVTPTLGHSDFPDNESYTPQKKAENKTIRDHFKTVYLQAEQDALAMIRKFDNPNDFVQIEHWDRLSALAYAVVLEQNKLVEAMLDRGINKGLLNKNEGEVRTPLGLATWRENEAIIKMLVDAGADPTIKCKYDGTPIAVILGKIRDIKQSRKQDEEVLRNNLTMIKHYNDVIGRSKEKISLEDYKVRFQERYEQKLEPLNKYKQILAIFKSADQTGGGLSMPKPVSPKNSEKSALQKSLSTLQKQLEQLKNKLQTLAAELTILKKNYRC